jgi:hypothetical protein
MKKLITTILSGAIITGGLVVGLQKPELPTIDEMNTLYAIYNQEIVKNPIILQGVNKDNIIQKLNEKLLKDTDKGTTIDGENLTAQKFNNLKRTLILKSEQKTLIEQIL